jgi:hypothetical protein
VTDQELKDIRQIVAALERLKANADGKCPWCSRLVAYGCVCSCPRRLALKTAAKNGWEPARKTLTGSA